MSALAKPGLYTPNSAAGAVSAAVNLELVKSVEKLDLPAYATSENNTPRAVIQWTMLATDGQEKTVTWNYNEDSAQRDTDYAAALGIFAAALP